MKAKLLALTIVATKTGSLDSLSTSGSWHGNDSTPRSYMRFAAPSGFRDFNLGFRVGRMLFAGAGTITVAPGAH